MGGGPSEVVLASRNVRREYNNVIPKVLDILLKSVSSSYLTH